jgi:hypothetical protein
MVFLSDVPQLREDGLRVISRREFAAERFDYKPGEHVVFGGQTTKGKTTLAFDLLEYQVSPDFPAYVAVSKPKDKTTQEAAQRLGFRRVSEWPTNRTMKELVEGHGPNGYLIWPKFGDIDTDMNRCAYVTKRLLGDRYTAGVKDKRGILVMDDTMIKSKILGLDPQMTTILAMAGAMGIGMWVMVQKPTDSGRTAVWAYVQAEHIFITQGGDRRTRLRYDEIADVQEEKLVSRALQTLEPYQFLYIKRTEGYTCVVDAK